MKSKKKIALVSNTSWSIYNFRIKIIRSFIDQGFDVYTIAPEDSYSSKLVAEGATFIPLKLNNYSFNPYYELKLLLQLLRLYRSHNFDFVFHYTTKPNIYGSIAGKLANLNYHIAITTGLGQLFSLNNLVLTKIATSLYRLACNCANETWFLNVDDRKKFIREGIVPKAKTRLLPSEGIDTNKFISRKKRKKTPIVRFLFAGRLLKQKGILDFAEAAQIIKKTHRNVRFEVLGFIDPKNPDSITYEEIKKWQKSGFIKYLGSTEDVRPYIDRADCIILPSHYKEGISRVLLEAASMATPIITSDNIGCRDLVLDNLSGYICKTNSVTSLLDKVLTFLSLDIIERKTMGINGRNHVRNHFSIEKVIPIYNNVILTNKSKAISTIPNSIEHPIF